MDCEATIEAIVRESYGRLLAYLAVRSSDFSEIEDALGDALLEGLKKWPGEGVPTNPCGWLLTVAKRRLIDCSRHEIVRQREVGPLQVWIEEAEQATMAADDFPDDRLKLLFVCAHPAIDPAARTPLMLQTVLGLDAERIAAIFLTSPSAMAQRLVRAKTKIKLARIPFRVPEAPELPERLSFVLEAIYAAYTAGWEGSPATEAAPIQAPEAVMLARLVVSLMPDEAEAQGLLALFLHLEARRPARFSSAGSFVPLLEQDPVLWSTELIEEAERHLEKAARDQRPGRYQLEAAIQSVHANRRDSHRIEWRAILAFYDALLALTGGIGAAIGRAAALAESGQLALALEALDAIPTARVQAHQPYWATRGHILAQAQRTAEAISAWHRAIGLTEDPAIREFLRRKIGGAQRMVGTVAEHPLNPG